MQNANIFEIIYSFPACMLKLAIAIQLYHTFAARAGRLYWVIFSFSVFTVAFYVSVIVARICACVPREKIWNPTVPGTCISIRGLMVTTASVNACLDVILILIPALQVRKLQVPLKKKIAVMIFFGVGLM